MQPCLHHGIREQGDQDIGKDLDTKDLLHMTMIIHTNQIIHIVLKDLAILTDRIIHRQVIPIDRIIQSNLVILVVMTLTQKRTANMADRVTTQWKMTMIKLEMKRDLIWEDSMMVMRKRTNQAMGNWDVPASCM